MSIAALAIAERSMADAGATSDKGKSPPRRTLIAQADRKLAPEPR